MSRMTHVEGTSSSRAREEVFFSSVHDCKLHTCVCVGALCLSLVRVC